MLWTSLCVNGSLASHQCWSRTTRGTLHREELTVRAEEPDKDPMDYSSDVARVLDGRRRWLSRDVCCVDAWLSAVYVVLPICGAGTPGRSSDAVAVCVQWVGSSRRDVHYSLWSSVCAVDEGLALHPLRPAWTKDLLCVLRPARTKDLPCLLKADEDEGPVLSLLRPRGRRTRASSPTAPRTAWTPPRTTATDAGREGWECLPPF